MARERGRGRHLGNAGRRASHEPQPPARLDQLPDAAKTLAQFTFEAELQKAQEKGAPGETPAQRDFRLALLRELGKAGSGILKDGAAMRLDIDVDSAAKDFNVRLSLTGQPGSELTRSFQTLGKSESPFAGALSPRT